MRVLSLDTTSRAGSVAIVDGDRILLERCGDATRPHAERLPSEVLQILAEAGMTTADVELFAIAAGPGSFTGLRIGIATIQGLALVERKQVVAVSSLDAAAHIAAQALSSGDSVGVWIDAQRRDVFSALYSVNGNARAFAQERLVPMELPAVGRPAQTMARWDEAFGAPTVITGDGAALYAAEVGTRSRIVPPPLLAGGIGLAAVERARQGDTTGPAGVQPLYVRRPDAEIARDSASDRSKC